MQMVQHEETGYTRWWPLFKSNEIAQPKSTTNAASAWSLLVHGRGLGLLSTKIAMRHRRATVVTMKYQGDDRNAHLSLTSLLGIQNNLLCETLVTSTVASSIESKMKSHGTHREQPFRYSVISLDIFEGLITTAQDLSSFEKSLGGLLSIASSSFVELPDWNVLAAALDTILVAGEKDGTWTDSTKLPSTDFEKRYLALAKARNSNDPWVGLLSAAVQQVKLEGVTMRVLEFEIPISSQHKTVLRTTSKSKKYNEGEGEQEKEDEDDEPEIYLKQPVEEHTTTMRVVRVDTRTWSKKDSPTFAHQNTIRNVGVDLSTLLAMGLVRQQKRILFKMYLHLPFSNIEANEGLSSIMSPSNVLVSIQSDAVSKCSW